MSAVQHIACPKCGSRDNRAVYPDHEYCFGCHDYKALGFRRQVKRPVEPLDSPFLPSKRLVKGLPSPNLEWLLKYDLKPSERNLFLYDPVTRRHVYPVYDSRGTMIFADARSVDGTQPKNLTYGGEKPLHVIGDKGPIVLVEDVVSAIKVSRYTRAMPLWGSHVSTKHLTFLRGMTDKLGIWLDHDKATDALKFTLKATLMGFDCYRIVTKYDPKECTEVEILDALSGICNKK